MRSLVIATRGSQLALWQAHHIQSRLLELVPDTEITIKIIHTRGDKILDVPLSQVGGKGLFVKEIEEALLSGEADLAVHSIKDVPMVLPDGLCLGCVPKREECADCLVSEKYEGFRELPQGARVGTSSLRRQAQLLAGRRDLVIVPLRGNVDTRLKKLRSGEFDAIVLAMAGLKRLELGARHVVRLKPANFMPAVGQGALGIECREFDTEVLDLVRRLEDQVSRACVDAERSMLRGLDGGCQVPIGAHAEIDGDVLILSGLVADVDGHTVIRRTTVGSLEDADAMGSALARQLLQEGADEILRRLYANGRIAR